MKVSAYIAALVVAIVVMNDVGYGYENTKYLCGQDMNRDGYYDGIGEVAGCQQRYDCSMYGAGDGWECRDGRCWKAFACSPAIVKSGLGWECPLSRRVYDDTFTCENNCISERMCGDIWECPIDTKLPCIENTYANRYHGNYTWTKYTNNGVIDAQGQCVGAVLRYNGWPGACTIAGWENNYTNCCDYGMASSSPYCRRSEQWDLGPAKAINSGQAVLTGVGCWTGITGIGCVQRAGTYCIFDDPGNIGVALHVEYREKLTGFERGFGGPYSPDCRGFTPEEIQNIRFDENMTRYRERKGIPSPKEKEEEAGAVDLNDFVVPGGLQ